MWRPILFSVNRWHLLRHPKSAMCMSSYSKKMDIPEPDRQLHPLKQKVKHPESEKYPGQHTSSEQKGKIYDKKPVKIPLEAGKKYSWCTCGLSKSQPMCDGSHKINKDTSFTPYEHQFKSHKFTVDETKEYWLCNCKQTNKRPFCDGAHKNQKVQDAIKG